MHKKLTHRIAASLLLSLALLAMPVGAVIGNAGTAISAYAGDDATGNDTETETQTGEEVTETEPETGEEVTETEPETQEPECTCTSKCSQYDHDKDCDVCATGYKDCGYREPSVKITINTPSGWYASGSNAKVTLSVADILDTGNFAVKSVKAKVGQNGSYQDVTEDMCLEVSEDCSVYVLVTDANGNSYERSRSIKCFDTTKPTLNAAVSNGLLTVQASDNDSGVKAVYVNGYEFTDVTNGTLNIRLSQFDSGYEYFTISAMDAAGNMSDVYKTSNPYYTDPDSDDDTSAAEQLPISAEATQPSSATATVTEHTVTDENGTTTSQTSGTTTQEQKKQELKKADADTGEATESVGDESTDRGREFYTIEAASGKVFYLIIDRDGDNETAYFLTEITENDLLNVTTDNSETLPRNSAAVESQIPVTESALPNNNTGDDGETRKAETPDEQETEAQTETETGTEAQEGETSGTNPTAGYIAIAALAAAITGAAYCLKKARKRQDGDFVEDEDDDDDSEYEPDGAESEDDDFFDKEIADDFDEGDDGQ